jgi:thiol-disulfide isomerase/thioredoxin
LTNATKSKTNYRGSKAERRAAEKRRQQRRRLGIGLGIAVAIAAALVFALTRPADTGQTFASGDVTIVGATGNPLAPGDVVPSFTAPALGGGTVDWSDYETGPVVLAIWAPWCPHCQKEMPILSEVVSADPSVRLVSVTTAVGQAPGPSPQEFMQERGLTFPVAVDDDQGTLGTGLGIQSFPTVYYVKDGVVVRTTTGEIPLAEYQAILAELRS